MRLRTIFLAVAAALPAGFGAAAAQAASVEIDGAVARVTVVPENRKDVRVEIARPNARTPLSVRALGDRTVIDGGLQRRIRNCGGPEGASWVEVRGLGRIDRQDMAQVIIRTPRDVVVKAEGAVFGTVGRSASLDLSNAGCGDWAVANVQGEVRISQAGSGDTRLGSAGPTRIRVAGSGDIAAADIRGGLDVNIAGSGSALVRSVSGPLEVSIAGSGDVAVGGGRATEMKVSIAGSGDVDFRGSADTLRARIAGSGDVHAREVRGEISRAVMGSGKVHVGG